MGDNFYYHGGRAGGAVILLRATFFSGDSL
jgi:hypothetical protein